MSNYFLLGIIRRLWRGGPNVLISIVSFSVGLTVFSLTFLYVKTETIVNRAWPESDSIYRPIFERRGLPGSADGSYDNISAQVFPALLDSYADVIDRASRLYTAPFRLADAEGNVNQSISFVDSDFPHIFQYEVEAGSLDQVLQGPSFIAISSELAQKNGWSVGSEITFVGNQPQAEVVYEVAAIFRAPPNISQQLNFEMLALMHDSAQALFTQGQLPWNTASRVWLKLVPRADLAALHASLSAFVDRVVTTSNASLAQGDRISNHVQYSLQPLTTMYLSPVDVERSSAGDVGKVISIGAIGIVVLLAGASNAIALSLAGILDRRREIGVRKASGASPSDIVKQHLGETLLSAMLALIVALLFVELLMTPFVTLLNIRREIASGGGDRLVIFLIAALVGILSGFYPGLVLSRVKPQHVLKTSDVNFGFGNVHLRTLLVICQFCFALLLMIGTLVVFAQLQVARDQPLGFSASDVLYLRPSTQQEIERAAGLPVALATVPGIAALTELALPPNVNLPPTVNVMNLVSKQEDIIQAAAQQISIAPGFVDILQIPLLAGRDFDISRDGYDSSTGVQEGKIMLNRTATRALGFVSPQAAVDQAIYLRVDNRNGNTQEIPMRVVGVIEDNMFASFRRKPGPEAYTMFTPQMQTYFPSYLIKLAEGADNEELQLKLKEVWQDITGMPLQSINYLDTELELAFNVERNENTLLVYSAALALILSSMGLYGLAAYAMTRNMKNVGVRKILGASAAQLIILYLWRYARLVLLASIIHNSGPYCVVLCAAMATAISISVGEILVVSAQCRRHCYSDVRRAINGVLASEKGCLRPPGARAQV
jgi:putative ABC transport system permease protein